MARSATDYISYGLYVVTAEEYKDNGCITNTACQVTTTPNRITLAVNKTNLTHDMIAHTGKFNVSMLSEEAPFAYFTRFGFQSGRDTDKFDGFSGYYIDSNGSRRIPDKESAERIITRIKGQTGFVSRIKIEKKSEKPPQLYDLTSLQRDANTRYGFSAKKTLDLAQKLYEERKLLTYPRTDSRYLPLDMAATVKRTLLH